MSDFSINYATNKNSMITFAKNNVFVTFKPFIESYSFEKSVNTIEVDGVFDISGRLLNDEKERKYSISFNVPAVDFEDAKNNHKKFHRLLRMIVPNPNTTSTFFYVKFANLIQKEKAGTFSIGDTVNSKSYEEFTSDYAVVCKVPGLNYSPDLELGFFDQDGMFFAKNFKIDLKLELLPESYPKQKHYDAQTIDDEESKKIKVGNLFGFPINYRD